jgi:choline dehydrogenase
MRFSLLGLAAVAAVAHETHTAVFDAPKKNFDVIVVGGGSAGSVVAARLTENPNVNVLVLEGGIRSHVCTGGTKVILKCYSGEECLDGPGAEYTPFDIPLWVQQALSQFTWGERHPDDVAKVLGGSGLLNGMSFYRGHPQDFTDLGTIYGLNGWDWPTVREYYKKSEGYRGRFEHDRETHNLDGPMRITDYPPDESVRVMQDSARAAGWRADVDLNGPNRIGFGWRSANARNGRRETTATAFLCPAMSRPNLEVRTEAEVSDLILERQNGELAVVGVKYLEGPEDNQREVEVLAPTVVMTAGIFGNPYIFLRSGIGPARELQELNIPVMLDLPGVGKNFQDDLSVQILYDWIDLFDPPRQGSQSSEDSLDWLLYGIGPFTAGTLENGFINGENETVNDRPTVMYRRRPFTGSVLLTLTPPPAGGPPTEVRLRPDKRGTVKLFTGPVPERDIEELAYGIEVMRRIGTFPPMATLQRENSPGPSVRTRDEIKEWVRARVTGFHHSQGTMRMGRRGDPQAVIDERFKVYGVKEGTLFVSDNSVFPRRLQTDSFADAVMAGERGADFIKEFFGW